MTDSSVVDIAIGLVFAYLLLGLLCTLVNEWIARLFSLRSKNLVRGLKQLLADPQLTGLAQGVLNHPLIKGSADNKRNPSYISSATFSRVLIDLLDKSSAGIAKAQIGKDLENTINSSAFPDEVKKVLTALVDKSDANIDDIRGNLQTWFDTSMERISGWYKRRLQIISIVVASILTIGLNVDTFAIGQALWEDPDLRTAISTNAATVVEKCKGEDSLGACEFFEDPKNIRGNLMKFPVGWPEPTNGHTLNWPSISKILGWLITALAVSLGAPFWFDMLDKLNSVRSAGIKPKSTGYNAV